MSLNTLGPKIPGQVKSLIADDVVRVLENITKKRHQYPLSTQAKTEPKFVSLMLDKSTYKNGATLDFSQLGKRIDNTVIESLNGSLRGESLNTNWFMSLEDAQGKIKT